MGLNSQSTGANILSSTFLLERYSPNDKLVAFAGNPNVGKSTVFNALTGLNQHTGNWPGKTVDTAYGRCIYKDSNFILVDLPGTYSILSSSVEEEVARDFICFGNPDATVIITDATCLERNLNLVLQTLEITNNVVVCVNLIDEAERKKISIDFSKLSILLGVPVISTSARENKGLDSLLLALTELSTVSCTSTSPLVIYDNIIENSINMIEPTIKSLVSGKIHSRWLALRLLETDESLILSLEKYLGFDLTQNELLYDELLQAQKYLEENSLSIDELRDSVVSTIINKASEISNDVTIFEKEDYNSFDRSVDSILTSKLFGIPIMILLLGIILWITIIGANYPSQLLSEFLFKAEPLLSAPLVWLNAPPWLNDMLISGVYRTLAWIVAVMLPPMAIFFPMFTLLEDLGYLPRVAFNLDNFFKKACAHGKQALTMCMGFGCNAAGVIGCRIIDSPRERLIAIITNSFVPCNGRFPTLIAIITMFFAGTFMGPFQSIVSSLFLTGCIVLGIIATLLISKILSLTILKGMPSSFSLELPPYRKPQIGKIIVRSIFDRTLFVLGRAVLIAIPAGLIIWLMANIHVGNLNILTICANLFDPFARLIGLDGYILMAFILGFPANEIVFPLIIMSYMSRGSMIELDSLNELRELLISNGWTWLTALCTMLFSLMHFPCATTCLTIKSETKSFKWTAISFLVPTLTGLLICFVVASIVRLLGLV